MDEHKTAKTEEDVKRLCTKYGIEEDKLASLTRFVSSPSIDGRTAVRTTGKDGEEGLTVQVGIFVQFRLELLRPIILRQFGSNLHAEKMDSKYPFETQA